MAERKRPPAGGRVVVAVDSARIDPPLLEAAGQLARRLALPLLVVLVEERALFDVAALPFTRELHAESGQWQPFEPADAERAIRAHTQRLARTIQSVTAGTGTEWSMFVERGVYPSAALDQVGPGDALLVDAGATLRVGARAIRDFSVLLRDPSEIDEAIELAGGLVRQARGAALRIVLGDGTGQWGDEARERVRERFARLGAAVLSVAEVSVSGNADWPRLVRTESATLCVVRGRSSEIRDEVAELFAALAGPLLWIGPGLRVKLG